MQSAYRPPEGRGSKPPAPGAPHCAPRRSGRFEAFRKKAAGRFAITARGMPYFKIEADASKENEPHSGNAGGSDTREFGAPPPPRDFGNSPTWPER